MKKETRIIIWNKYGNKCAYCGCKLEYSKMQVDHINPLWRGHNEATKLRLKSGTDDINNLNPSCARCNKWKSTWSIEQFRQEIKLQIERLNKYNNNYKIAKDYHLIKEIDIEVKFYFESNENNMYK